MAAAPTAALPQSPAGDGAGEGPKEKGKTITSKCPKRGAVQHKRWTYGLVCCVVVCVWRWWRLGSAAVGAAAIH